MKKLTARVAGSYCRRPVLWLTALLLAALASELVMLRISPPGFAEGSVSAEFLAFFAGLMYGRSIALSVLFPLVLATVNLFFLLAGDASEAVLRAGARTELYSLVYTAAFACTYILGLQQPSGISDTHAVFAVLFALPFIVCVIGFAVVRAPDGSVRPLSRRALRTMLAVELLCAAACLASGTFSLLGCPSSVCMAIISLKLCRDLCARLRQEPPSAAAAAEQPCEESGCVAESAPSEPRCEKSVSAADPTPSGPPCEKNGSSAEPAPVALPCEENDTAEPIAAAVTERKRPFSLFTTILIASLAAVVFFALPLTLCVGTGAGCAESAVGGLALLVLGGIFVLLPCMLTLFNIVRLFLRAGGSNSRYARLGRIAETVTLVWGYLCTVLWADLGMSNIVWKDWHEQLYNAQVHSPVSTESIPTLVTLLLASFAGYLVLRLTKPAKLPPLTAALSFAALYLGGAVCTVWIMQVFFGDPVLCLFPFNILLIYARVIRDAVTARQEHAAGAAEHRSAVIRFLARIISDSRSWPWLALVLAVPLLGIIIALLTLFGQAPDSVIRAWTQTADWSFSQHIAPQNLHYDEHYLCTVAAGGHKRVVRPLRRGKRHGHEVTVNRQLCVANAFEQLIEERAPRFHSLVRGVYDKYGYPIARHIKTPLAADLVWVLMKPLEWLFLGVLYLFDPKPENRIAVQYPHAPLPESMKRNELI